MEKTQTIYLLYEQLFLDYLKECGIEYICEHGLVKIEVKESGIMSRLYNLGYYFGLWRKSDNEARANYYIREVKKLFNI